jgi:hypothetical protein
LLPFGTAYCAEEHRIGTLRLEHGIVCDRDLVSLVASTSDERLLDIEACLSLLAHPGDEFLDFAHDLGADAVAP